MGICGAVGTHYKRRGGCTRPGDGELSDDLVNRAFDPEGPDRLWCMDITEHPTGTGKVYLAVVLDAWSRRVVGWSIADHMRAELVADAVQMATWRRQPPKDQVIAHSDHGGQFTSVRFTERLDEIGARPSIGTVADSYDNALAHTTNGLYKTECVYGPDASGWGGVDELELATLSWVYWFNRRATARPLR